MRYRDDEYEYESRRRELEQRRRVRPDAEMTSQRRKNTTGQTAGSRRTASGTRSTSTGSGARTAAGARTASGTGSRSASRNSYSAGAPYGASARTGTSRRTMGTDPYDRRTSDRRTAAYDDSYEDMSTRKRTRTETAPSGRNGKKRLSAKAKKKRRNRKILFAVEGVLLVLVLLCLFVISKWDLIQKASFGKKDVHVNELSENTLKSMEGYRTIAIFGIDENGSHSDVIMVANVDNKTGEISLTSVLRDTYWNVPDLSTGDMDKYAKANNAYHTGEELGALNAINKNLDLQITEYVSVNWYAVAQVVDLLGGLEIDVPETMMGEINGYITNTVEETKSWATGLGKGSVQLKGPGLQTLDGIQTVAYCRIRHNNGGDDGRAQRQREVIGMILDKAKSASASQLLDICNAVFPEIRTNLTLADVLALVPDIGSYKITKTAAFPYHQVDAMVGGASVKVPLGLAEDVTQFHQELFGDTTYEPSSTVKQISNKIEALTGYSAEDRTN